MVETEKDVKESIIIAASQMFAKYGYTKTTMNDIANAAKKAKSSLYHYFPGKENVFEAILDKEFCILRNELNKAISGVDTPQKKLRAFFLTRMDVLQKLGNFYTAVKDEYLDHYGFIEKLRKKYDDEEISVIKKILALGIEHDIFAIKDLEIAAFSIFITVKALEQSWILENTPEQNKKNLEHIMDIYFYGINKR